MSAIINLRHEPKLREAFEYAQVVNNTVLIDRRTKWGNPFRVTGGVTHAEAVARYRLHLWRQIGAGEVTLEELAELDGCWLACWCAGDGHPCHGEVLERAAAWAARMRDAPPCSLSNAVPGRTADWGVRVERYSPRREVPL